MKSTILNLKAIALLIFFLSIINNINAQVCVTIKGGPTNTQLADVISSSPTITNATPQYFQAAQWTYGGVPGESRDLLSFDLSSIPAGSVITSAKLNLYADTSYGNGNMSGNADSTYLLQVTSPWNENTVTWNTQPTTTTTGEVLLSQSTSIYENYLNLDVSTFVQSWVNNPSQNYGIMSKIITPNYYNHMIFYSGYYPDSAFWPTLVICYTPAPTCTTIIGGPSNTQLADVISSSPTITNTTPQYFQAAQWTYGGVPGESRDLLSFDLSSIPAGSVITSANLNLYADTSYGNGNMSGNADSTYLLQVTSPWNENTVTWNTQPTTTTTGEVLLSQSTSIYENYLNLDVSTFVQSWVNNPSQNYGIMSKIITPNYYNHMIFYSGYSPDTAFWPTLVICYTPSTGINPVSTPEDNNMAVYPNPNNGHLFNVKLPGNMEINNSQVIVYDMLGREVPLVQIERQEGRFVVSLGVDTQPGIYMVGLANGERQLYCKIIVSR